MTILTTTLIALILLMVATVAAVVFASDPPGDDKLDSARDAVAPLVLLWQVRARWTPEIPPAPGMP